LARRRRLPSSENSTIKTGPPRAGALAAAAASLRRLQPSASPARARVDPAMKSRRSMLVWTTDMRVWFLAGVDTEAARADQRHRHRGAEEHALQFQHPAALVVE